MRCQIAFGVGDGDGEQARQPWDIIAREMVRIAAAVKTFVMAADGGADGGKMMDESGQFLAQDRDADGSRPIPASLKLRGLPASV